VLRPQIGFKTHRGKVIHRLASLRLGGTLRSAVNNFGKRIRVGEASGCGERGRRERLAHADAQPHDGVAVNVVHPLGGADAHALAQGGNDLDFLFSREIVGHTQFQSDIVVIQKHIGVNGFLKLFL
jgi:hypothetical protein